MTLVEMPYFGPIRVWKCGILALGCLLCQGGLTAASFGDLRILPATKGALASFAVPGSAQFTQVCPVGNDAVLRRSPNQFRATVLIHGLRLHPLRPTETVRARLHGWQRPGSTMVRMMARHADVFAFAYSQDVPVECIATDPCLADGIRRLRWLGYSEIILIGHSAGGLIARQFVEDNPGVGVTRVIQVCTPNMGTGGAKLENATPGNQLPFLRSLTKEAREQSIRARTGKCIPAGVEFTCVVGCGAVFGDGVVSVASQWPRELRVQGAGACYLMTTHYTVMRSPFEIKRIVELAFPSAKHTEPAFLPRSILKPST